jgi:NTE family protein
MGVWRTQELPPRIGLGRHETGLVLPGGGARAAYQVGVLKAIARLLPPGSPCPFPVITGTSAGAINAVALACYADRFRAGVRILESVWSEFTTDQVYRTDIPAMLRSSLHWMATVCLGGLGRYNPRSVFDNHPLRTLLTKRIPVERIQRNIDSGVLHAVSVTVSSYRTGRSVSFFQGHPSAEPWHRARREGRRARIGVCHMMASAAVPMVFPAEAVDGEFFGDGALRQMLPLSPAVHLGAGRLLVVGVRPEPSGPIATSHQHDRRPTLGHLTGYLLDTLFMDGLYSDLERITRINLLLEALGDRRAEGSLVGLRRLETMVVLPGADIRKLAMAHVGDMPLAVRLLLRGLGAHGSDGGQLLSYLLFEQGFTRALIDLGYRDAMARRDHVLALLRGDPMPAIDAPRKVAEDLSGQEDGTEAEKSPEAHHVGHGR